MESSKNHMHTYLGWGRKRNMLTTNGKPYPISKLKIKKEAQHTNQHNKTTKY